MQWWRDLKCFFLQHEPGLNVWHGKRYDHARCLYCGRAIHRTAAAHRRADV